MTGFAMDTRLSMLRYWYPRVVFARVYVAKYDPHYAKNQAYAHTVGIVSKESIRGMGWFTQRRDSLDGAKCSTQRVCPPPRSHKAAVSLLQELILATQ